MEQIIDIKDIKREKESEKPKDMPESLSWKTSEYEHSPKTTDWYWSVGILTAGIVIVALITGNFLLGILALIAGFTIMLYGARAPRMVQFTINHKGIIIEDRLYQFENLESFWIHYDPPDKKELGIVSEKFFMPRITIPLDDTDPNDIRNHLIQFLEEEAYEESLIEALSKYLGF